MNIKDAVLFLAIAEENSVTRAAKKIGYTESGASHIIKNLEKEVGFPLFARTKKGLTLTPNGERLMPHMRRLLNAHELFIEEASTIRGVQEGHIVIGSYASAAIHWLPIALKRFHGDYPNITVEVREGKFDEIESWLEEGSVDFGITGYAEDSKMDWLQLLEDTYFAICSLDSPFAKQDNFKLKDLEDTPSILPKFGADHALHVALNTMNIKPNILFTTRSKFTIMAMISQNLAVSVLPELGIRGYKGNNVMLPLDPPVYRILGIRIPSLKEASPASQIFIKYLQNTVSDLEARKNPEPIFTFETNATRLQ